MKRFWKTVTTERTDDGWRILLDSRPVSTPARQPCLVPVAEMAEAIACEWDARDGEIRPLEMPMTRTAATCIDRVLPNLAEVHANVAAYGGTDLLCYRAERPVALNVRQREGWDPILDWAAETFHATLETGHGVMHIPQPEAALTRLAAEVERTDPWQLTALSELTTISGSLLLALAVLHGRLTAVEAWRLSRIDEQWNIEEWGEDAEAAAQAARHEAEFLHSAAVLALLRAA
jgi:chaperone required for assembly of F1-ATPase